MKKQRILMKKILVCFLAVSMMTAGAAPAWAENGAAAGAGSSGSPNAKTQTEVDTETQDTETVSDEYIVWYDDLFETKSARSKSADSHIALLMDQPEVISVETSDPDTAGDDAGLALVKVDPSLSDEEEKAFIENIEAEPGVKTVEKNRKVHAYGKPDSLTDAPGASDYKSISAGVTDDAYSEQQYALTSVRADEAWNMMDYATAAKIKVAVVDSGVDATHPDLQGKILPGYNFVEYDSVGRKYSTDDASDDNGHGTHVAGIIAAVSNNSMGVSGVTGALDVQILPVKVLDDEGNGTTYDVVKGIKYAADNGVDFINLSLGSNYASAVEEAAVDYALSKGTLCIAAAGNEGTDVSTSFPAAYDSVMAIGSIDSQDERSYFSNYGKGLDLSAPGSSILSTIPEQCVAALQAEGRKVYGNPLEGYYAVFSGTSMATPCAVGVAVIYKAVNPYADCSDIRQHLNATARDIGDIGFDIYTGNGCIDAAAALGEPIKQIAVRMKSPKSNDEIYEKTSVSFQVNTNMGINHVNLYINEVSDSKKLAEIKVEADQALYNYVFDTKQYNDGDYTLILQGYSADESPVGEAATAKGVQIVNTIQNGFVIEASDPKARPSDSAVVEVYGKAGDSAHYELIYSGETTDLGYCRINDPDPDNEYSSYSLRITGSYGESGSLSYYSYRLPDVKKGTRIIANAETTSARKTAFSMKDTSGSEISEPYILLAPIEDGQELNDMPVWTMYSGSEIYLSEGDYHYETYWSPSATQMPDYTKAAYYLSGTSSISASGNNIINADYHDAGMLRGEFGNGFDGVLQVSLDTAGDRIPFLPAGYIKGKVIYLTPAKYDVKAIVSREIDGETWSVTLQKNDPYTVSKGSEQTVYFSANVKLAKFEPAQNSLRTDVDGTNYLYRGEILRTLNEMSVDGDAVISGFSGDYPTFSVYRVNDDRTRELVYQVTDTWQAKGSTWNSSRVSSATGVLPEAGSYVAELVFDAGPMGGKSEKTIEFELRNRSGSSETDSTAVLGSSYILPRAEITLFRWNDESQGWVNAMTTGESIVYDDDGRASLVENNIELDSDGINVALVKYSYRQRNTSAIMEPYNGFQLYYYTSIDDLKRITLSDSVSRVYVRIKDRFGIDITTTNKGININAGVSSSGNGKLTESRFLTDVQLPAGTLYIPDEEYEYIMSAFTAYNEEYFLIKKNVSTASGEVVLDGKQSKKVTVQTPDDMQGVRIYPDTNVGGDVGAGGLDFRKSAVFYLSEGTYSPEIILRTSDASQQITVKVPEFELNADRTITTGSGFSAAIALKQSSVNKKQNLSGDINITDVYGNRLTGIAVKNGVVYEPVAPEVTIGAGGAEGAAGEPVDGASYTEFRITPEHYAGTGKHFVKFTCSIGSSALSCEAYFDVVDESANSSVSIRADEAYEVTDENGSACAVIRSGKDGYRIVTVDIPSSVSEQNIVFTQTRNGAVIAETGISDVFDNASNTYSVGFMTKAGDSITVSSRI